MNIDEVIADAKAEEDAKKVFKPLEIGEKVTIPLREYVHLKQKEIDFDRLLGACADSLVIGYDELHINNNKKIAETFRVLFPNIYAGILAEKKEDNDGPL